MKTLLTNGCSWTFGGGLDIEYTNPEILKEKVWPHHLKNSMNFDQVVQLAEGCGSNQRIFRTTVNWIMQQSKETLENTTAVIQWTEWSRYEYYVHNNNGSVWDNVNEINWSLNKVGLCLSPVETNIVRGNTNAPIKINEDAVKFVSDRNNLRLQTYTEIEGYYTYLTQCEALASIFKRYGIKYYYWNFVSPMFALPEPHKSFLLDNYNWLEPHGKHTWDYDRISNQDPHPSILGHQQLAVHIKSAIESMTYYG
jgi:hypothetical protein